MSFSWRGLLNVGGNLATQLPPQQPSFHDATYEREEIEWAPTPDDPMDLPNMLGMENFGNTCYVNSVMQLLWFCDPFRESILAYMDVGEKMTEKASVSPPNSDSDQLAPTAQEGIEKLASTSSDSVKKDVQDLEPSTLFIALRTLFQRMSNASITVQSVPRDQVTPSTSNYLVSGLSRKASSRPGTGSGQAASGLGTASKMSNCCTTVLVPDHDIKAFLASLKKSNMLFDSTAHQDAHELLNHILNAIGDEIVQEASSQGRQVTRADTPGVLDVTPGGKTLVHRLFEGVLTNETRCLTCETVSSRDESFLDLSLDIERNTSVSACLQQFSASEMLCARNKFFCDTCSGLQEAEKRMKIKKQPNVLALHLKRFKYEESMGRVSRLNRHVFTIDLHSRQFVKLAFRVVFPMELRLCNTSDDADDPDKLYRLYGIIVHIGTGPHHGHYIAILRVSSRWFVFDDETIRVIDEEDIQRYYGDTPGTGSAYVLFYQAVDLDLKTLGLPDLEALRQEKTRKRRQEQSRPLASLFASNGLSADSAQPEKTVTPEPITSPPSRTSTPAEGKASRFGRRASNVNSPGATDSSPTPLLTESVKGSSWLSSLRPRKASVSTQQLTVPETNNGSSKSTTPSPPAIPQPLVAPVAIPAKASTHLSSPEAKEDDTVPRSSSSRTSDLNVPSNENHLEHKSRQQSPTRVSDTNNTAQRNILEGEAMDPSPSTNTVKIHVPSSRPATSAGAAWAPLDRPLNKKEQEKIAKHARRRSGAGGPLADLSTPSDISQLGLGSPPSSKGHAEAQTSSGGGRVFTSSGRKTSLRRPSTANPQLESDASQANSRRRSTLSRTFGFGRKDKS